MGVLSPHPMRDGELDAVLGAIEALRSEVRDAVIAVGDAQRAISAAVLFKHDARDPVALSIRNALATADAIADAADRSGAH